MSTPFAAAAASARPKRSVSTVDYSGCDEPGGEVRPEKTQKMAGTPAVETAGGLVLKKMAPIFAKSPALVSDKPTLGEELRGRAKSGGMAVSCGSLSQEGRVADGTHVDLPGDGTGCGGAGAAQAIPKDSAVGRLCAQSQPGVPRMPASVAAAVSKTAPKAGAPKVSASKASVPKPKSTTSGLEMHRRALGDAVKAKIQVEKWCIGASCHCSTRIALDVFRNLVVPNAADVTPAQFGMDTPVVVASIRGTSSAGEIFGKTKITGGTRMGSWSADKMELVFFPPTGELRVWWTMR